MDRADVAARTSAGAVASQKGSHDLAESDGLQWKSQNMTTHCQRRAWMNICCSLSCLATSEAEAPDTWWKNTLVYLLTSDDDL